VLGLEARRVDFFGARWTGVRATVTVPVVSAFRVATEVELVRPDEARGRGSLWPWALTAIAWRPASGWETAVGVETSAGPEHRAEANALARLSYAFDRSPTP
jgi:hypothetical protein